jgi:hypothetical protein
VGKYIEWTLDPLIFRRLFSVLICLEIVSGIVNRSDIIVLRH